MLRVMISTLFWGGEGHYWCLKYPELLSMLIKLAFLKWQSIQRYVYFSHRESRK